MFFSVDCQLLLTCLQHRVVPSVLHPTQRVMSMTVNNLHQVFSKTYTEKFSPLTERKSTMHIWCYNTVHHLHQVFRSKRWIHVLSVHRDENDSSDNFWWVLKITLYMWSPIIQSSYMKVFQSVSMCIVAKRSYLGTSAFCHISNWHGIVELCSTGFNEWSGVHLTWVHLHSATCQTDMA